MLEPGKPRETRIFNGRTYVMETALAGDVAILRAWKVDEAGNCQFRYVSLLSRVFRVLEPEVVRSTQV